MAKDEAVEDVAENWYMFCVEEACSHPLGSIPYIFWWSCRWQLSDPDQREDWASNPEKALSEWIAYFAYKLEFHLKRGDVKL